MQAKKDKKAQNNIIKLYKIAVFQYEIMTFTKSLNFIYYLHVRSKLTL